MQIQHIAVVLRLTASVLGIATRTRVVFEHHSDTYALLDNLTQRLLARSEIFVTTTRLGVDTSRHTDTDAQDFTAVDTASLYKIFDIAANLLQTLRAVDKLKIVVIDLFNNVVLEVGNHIRHIVATDIHTCKV